MDGLRVGAPPNTPPQVTPARTLFMRCIEAIGAVDMKAPTLMNRSVAEDVSVTTPKRGTGMAGGNLFKTVRVSWGDAVGASDVDAGLHTSVLFNDFVARIEVVGVDVTVDTDTTRVCK